MNHGISLAPPGMFVPGLGCLDMPLSFLLSLFISRPFPTFPPFPFSLLPHSFASDRVRVLFFVSPYGSYSHSLGPDQESTPSEIDHPPDPLHSTRHRALCCRALPFSEQRQQRYLAWIPVYSTAFVCAARYEIPIIRIYPRHHLFCSKTIHSATSHHV